MEDPENNLGREVFFSASIVLAVFLFGFLVFGSLLDLPYLQASIKNNLPSQDLFVRSVNNAIGKESPKMSFIQENSLLGIIPPTTITPQVLGSILAGLDDGLGPESGQGIIEYIVEPGDTLSSIAGEYSISLQTILWANDLNTKSVISPGQKLIIPPVSGVIYYVKKGDTLSEIAEVYKGDVEKIIAFNDLSDEGDIFVGDILIIPDGEMPKKNSSVYTAQVPLGSSYFICPHSNCYITQGLHWYNAVDFGGKCGDPLYAVAAGVVQRVDYGWNRGAGNYIRILHPNGVVTMYGHIQKSLVSPGQRVSQGQIIAVMGGQPGTPGAGISTGCHVHFDVRGARNPFAK